MATTEQHLEEEEVDQFIENDEILDEVPDDDDEPMEEDEEEETYDNEENAVDVVWEDNSLQHFSGHHGSVFTVTTHPSQPIVVSGGEDDLGYIWNLDNGEIITKLTGHTDSVTCTAFSSDGELVSTGGMDGRVRVWRRVGKQDYKNWEFLTELQGPDEVMASSFFKSCIFIFI